MQIYCSNENVYRNSNFSSSEIGGENRNEDNTPNCNDNSNDNNDVNNNENYRENNNVSSNEINNETGSESHEDFLQPECEEEVFLPQPYLTNINVLARQNWDYRREVWSGETLQMVVMCIPPHGEIGGEIHRKSDQIIRVEAGFGVVMAGECEEESSQARIRVGDTVFIPAGTWHNIVNTGRFALKLSSIYAPPYCGEEEMEICVEQQEE